VEIHRRNDAPKRQWILAGTGDFFGETMVSRREKVPWTVPKNIESAMKCPGTQQQSVTPYSYPRLPLLRARAVVHGNIKMQLMDMDTNNTTMAR
jgi:hypothetical protein